MNADSADNRFPHLDLGDLITGAAGETIGDRAREHRAGCEQCQLEASRWNLVADGVRGLAAAGPQPAPPGWPRRRGRRGLAGPGRGAIAAVSAAAALVLLGGAGYGLAAALSGHSSGTGIALTAVTGCARLEQAEGTLQHVNGSLVIKTASGRLVTVTTTVTTRLNASGALLSDIADGAPVLVTGPSSGGTTAAALVVVGGRPSLRALPGLVIVQGTIADAGTGGFTVVTSAGTRVPVTVSGSTAVTVFGARPAQLQAGASTTAVGYAGPDGTLSALAVLQPPAWPGGAHATVTLTVGSCSRTSIDRAITALASGG